MTWSPRRARLIAVGVLVVGLLALLTAGSGVEPAERLHAMAAPLVPAAAAWGPGAIADGYVRAGRRASRCANPLRGIRNGPNKYLLARCSGVVAAPHFAFSPTRQLLPEDEFASLIAEDTCNTAGCVAQARARHGRWALVDGLDAVRPRTIASCERARNVDFATDEPAAGDHLIRRIPPGTPVRWRYATRGGGWVMARWSAAGRYAWAFIPRSCVADPPRWSRIALWRWKDHHRPTTGHRFRVLRRALPCPSRQRCASAD